ncbi:creatininase family protein [Methylobacterium nonmethylotrophicum]|uniref:Creatininase family protein n=1 Tax=Methylobacterium nonmethylotrophicum TaxID=1141884 RepID=A0A4Z0NMS4_9HYPH|nr:creatininase family protein [Methylobacterium nonmethylotrophicum]TGD97169.1 creatininase family protein [Methylobacterium nonmethylotrophicum]
MPARPWGDLTTEECRGGALAGSVAVLPVAAIEQHGPHLPLATDAIIAEGYLARVMDLVPDDLDVRVLPVQQVGLSIEHADFPGTLTLSPETALKAWTGIGAGVARAGCGRLVIVSSHGGNSALIDLVALELRGRHGMVAVTTAWSRFGAPPRLLPEDELRHGIHGGGLETALMLALRPDLVRREAIRDFVPATRAMERDFTHLRAGRPAALAWHAQDLNPAGAIGDARLGTAEAGRALLDHGARAFVALLRDVARFALPGPVSRRED